VKIISENIKKIIRYMGNDGLLLMEKLKNAFIPIAACKNETTIFTKLRLRNIPNMPQNVMKTKMLSDVI
jgi:hypothetical protein